MSIVPLNRRRIHQSHTTINHINTHTYVFLEIFRVIQLRTIGEISRNLIYVLYVCEMFIEKATEGATLINDRRAPCQLRRRKGKKESTKITFPHFPK